MFYLFKHTIIITEIYVLAAVAWGYGGYWVGIRKGLVGDWDSYSGDIV